MKYLNPLSWKSSVLLDPNPLEDLLYYVIERNEKDEVL